MPPTTSQTGQLSLIIKVGTAAIDQAANPIDTVMVNKTIGKIAYAKVTVHEGGATAQEFPVLDSSAFAIGKKITIQAGYGKELAPIFEGIIVKHSLRAKKNAGTSLIVTCRDIAYKTTLVRKNVSFQNVTDSEAFKEILSKYSGLAPAITATTIQHECLVQADTTDWDFIRVRAEALGYIVVTDDGTLKIKEPGVKQKGSVALVHGDNIKSFDAEMDARQQWGEAEGKLWQAETQASKAVKAADPGEQSFGKVGYKELSKVNDPTKRIFYHPGDLAEGEMDAWAKSQLAFSRLSKIRGKAVIQGCSDITPDSVVTIEEGATSFQGDAYVSAVQHIIRGGNWDTEVVLGGDFANLT